MIFKNKKSIGDWWNKKYPMELTVLAIAKKLNSLSSVKLLTHSTFVTAPFVENSTELETTFVQILKL
jgi:hypothetical protein